MYSVHNMNAILLGLSLAALLISILWAQYDGINLFIPLEIINQPSYQPIWNGTHLRADLGGKLEFALVSDLDERSRDPQEFLWKSIVKKGWLIPDPLQVLLS